MINTRTAASSYPVSTCTIIYECFLDLKNLVRLSINPGIHLVFLLKQLFESVPVNVVLQLTVKLLLPIPT